MRFVAPLALASLGAVFTASAYPGPLSVFVPLSVASPVAQDRWNSSDGSALDWFGFSVGCEGDWRAAGAPFESEAGPRSGAAYVRSESTGTESKLLPIDPIGGLRFGSALDLSGNTLVVGAPGNAGVGVEPGRAYVFEWQNNAWVETAILQSPSAHGGDGFGSSVAIDGDRLVVGAPWNQVAGAQSGSACAFERVGGQWSLLQEFRAGTTGPGDFFGFSVDVHAGRVAVGAYSANPVVFNEGAVYLFDWQAGLPWRATLLDLEPTPNSNFGRSVSLYGDRIAVGQTRDHSSLLEPGRVQLYGWDGTTWSPEATLRAPGVPSVDAFGFSIDLQADQILVGAPLAIGPNGRSGDALLFEPYPGGWVNTRRGSWSQAAPGDYIGVDVALGSTGAAVGAMRDQALGWYAGAVHLLDGGGVETPPVVSYCGCEEASPCGTPGSPAGSPAGCPNSTGLGASAGILGSLSVAQDDLVLTMSGLPLNSFGFFWLGDGSTNVALYDGYRCVSASQLGLFRLPIGATDANGVIATGPGIVGATQSTPGAILVGSRWTAQGIYRDGGGPCGTGINLSDAIWLTFQP